MPLQGGWLLECLVYLCLGKRYAESGLEDLKCDRDDAPSSDTLLRRLKKLEANAAYTMLVHANDELIRRLKRRRLFRMPVLAAVDFSDDRFYGRYNSKIRRSKKDRGTNLFYTHASLHVVERGKRVTIFTVQVLPLDDHAMIVEKLMQAARERGIRIHTLLIDRGFSSVDVKNVLDRLRIRYLTPAIKNDNVKEATEKYDNGLIPAMVRFTMKNNEQREASYNLLIYRKKDAKASDPVHKRYIAFATNMPYDTALFVFGLLPEEYRRRWGIESAPRNLYGLPMRVRLWECGLAQIEEGTVSVATRWPELPILRIRGPQRKRTQRSTVSLMGGPSQFSSCEGYHGVVGRGAYHGCRGSQQLAVVESIPTLPRGPLLYTHDGAASPVSRRWHAEKAVRTNSGDQAASSKGVTPPISESERVGDALPGVGWAHSTDDVRDSTTLKTGRGPAWMRGCCGRTDESIPRKGYEVSFIV